MHHHRSVGTAALVALMAAHRAAASDPAAASAAGAQPLRTQEIDRALERLYQPGPPPSGGERQPLA